MGIFLVDLAKHAARAHAVTAGQEPAEVLKRIREGFDVEWDQPTDEPTGGLLDDE